MVEPESLKWTLPIASWASELTSKEVQSPPFYPETIPGTIREVTEPIRSPTGLWPDKQEERL